jgi:hypothetical protein
LSVDLLSSAIELAMNARGGSRSGQLIVATAQQLATITRLVSGSFLEIRSAFIATDAESSSA